MHRLMEALNIVSVTVTSETSQKLNRSVAKTNPFGSNFTRMCHKVIVKKTCV